MKNPIPAQITQLKTMSKTVRITIDTQETLTQEQKAELFDLYDGVGYFFFFPNGERMEVDTANLPPITLEAGEKSPSQRLRGALFIYWDQNVRGKEERRVFSGFRAVLPAADGPNHQPGQGKV